MNISSIGAAGAIGASQRFEASAGRVASGQGDLASEAVEQSTDKAAFSASIAVIRASDEMTKRLLDITV